MKFIFRVQLLLSILALWANGARAERVEIQGLGMVAAELTTDELADQVDFELVLQPYAFDARKQQGPEGTMGLMEVNQSYDQIVTWLKKAGFTVVGTDPSCATIKLEGTREQLAETLQITFVRQTASDHSILVPVPGRSFPYRPAGSLLSIENFLMDMTAPVDSPEDQHLVKEWHPIHDRVSGS